MTNGTEVRVTFVEVDEADELGPASHVVHRFELTVAPDTAGEPLGAGPCGVISTELDHGVTILADPLRPSGLLGAIIDLPGVPIAEVDRHFASDDADDRAGGMPLSDEAATLIRDLLGGAVVEALVRTDTLRNVGDAEQVAAVTTRWELARQLAWCESEAARHRAPTSSVPSLWAADSALIAQRLSPTLSAWAATRAEQGAEAIAALSPADAIDLLAPVWPTMSELTTVLRSLVGDGAMGDAGALFIGEAPAIDDVDAVIEEMEPSPLAFRGPSELASRDREPSWGAALGSELPLLGRPLMLGADQQPPVPAVVIGPVVAVLEPSSVRAEWQELDRELVVTALLSEEGRAVAADEAGRDLLARDLVAVCSDAISGTVTANRGFAFDGDELTARLKTPDPTETPGRFEVRVYRRGWDDHRPRDERSRGDAIDAGRDALAATYEAFSTVPGAPAARRAAADKWARAAQWWTLLEVESFAERCRDLAGACRDHALDTGDPDSIIEVDLGLAPALLSSRLGPGVRRVLERQADALVEALEASPAVDAPSAAHRELQSTARTFVRFARTLGVDEPATEVAIEAARAAVDAGATVDEADLNDSVWAAAVLGERPDLVRASTRLLAALESNLDDER